jgi:hypothetical protein
MSENRYSIWPYPGSQSPFFIARLNFSPAGVRRNAESIRGAKMLVDMEGCPKNA